MSPITRVSVLSTGTVQLHPEHVEGGRAPMMWWLNTSRKWTAPRPINVYVIEHEKGLVLFDAGQDRRAVIDPAYFPGGMVGHVYRRLAKLDLNEEDTVTAQLRGLGYDIADVRIVILSHLHLDHIGGLRELPKSTQILASSIELAEVERQSAAVGSLLRSYTQIPGLNWTPITPSPSNDESIAPFTDAHDVLGDGSLLLLPTPGHTAGSTSLLLRSAGLPSMLFVGDLAYDADLLAADRVPGVGNRTVLHETTNRVNQLAATHPGMQILAAHDPSAARLLEAALSKEE
jgi:N-acyl homoserine lactone hydrolase